MEDIVNSIIYGKLEVEVPKELTLKQELEIIRAIVCNPSSIDRVKFLGKVHPWVSMLLSEIKRKNNDFSIQKATSV